MEGSPFARDRTGAAQAPTGTIALLFTDIEGSTRRWDQDAQAMKAALRVHDRLVRAVVERERGYVFKTIGDAFCVAFARPEEALRAAQGVHDALAGADFGAAGEIRVRIAVHCGTAHERDGDYTGPTVQRVGQLLAAGHGGQTLVSGTAAELARDGLPPGTRLVDLGLQKLKDLERPEHVFQIDFPGRTTTFPPLRTLTARANNLPTVLTSFVGRERDVNELDTLIAQHRIVTIVGSGGIGKTRTSLQVAAHASERFPDGVWFVEFAPLDDGAFVAGTIAGCIGVQLAGDRDPVHALSAALGTKRVLLVLDNCEHLIATVALLAAALVAACPEIAILATSRQPLGISGEHPYRMPTLALPADGESAAVTARSAVAYDAIRLFVERAVALDSTFAITDASAPVIAEICRRLDGIALAIELAAARVRILAPVQLRDRLDKRLKLLTGAGRAAPPRQQTLRALIDWSYDLLDARERALFVCLGIFADGFTLEAVTAVSGDAADEFELLDLLASLVDKSLVAADVKRDPARYYLLESMRAYALEKLDQAAARAPIADRHLRYFAVLAQSREQAYDGTRRDDAFEALADERDNVRAALTWAFDGGAGADGALLLAASRHLWRRWSASPEGVERCMRAAATGAFDAATTARLLNVAAFLAYKTGRNLAALDAGARAVPAAQTAGDPAVLFDALLCRALPLMFAGRIDEAETDIVAATTLLGPAPTLGARTRIVEARGIMNGWREDYARAAAAFAELAGLHRASGSIEGELHASCNLAECEHARGQTSAAIGILRGQLVNAQHLGTYWNAYVLANLAGYLASISELGEAHTAARRAIELSTSDPGAPLVANALDHFGLTLALANDPARAARLVGYCNATRAANAFRRQHTEQTNFDRLLRKLQERLPPDELDALHAQGAALSAPAAVELALLAEALT